jgi:hypothetical protein
MAFKPSRASFKTGAERFLSQVVVSFGFRTAGVPPADFLRVTSNQTDLMQGLEKGAGPPG